MTPETPESPAVDVRFEDVPVLLPEAVVPIAVRITPPRGWHVYWGENSGQSGLPTRATLTGAETVGPVRWSAPERYVAPGGIVDYVYSSPGWATFLVRTGYGEHTLTAEVHWLVCKDACIPGSATVTTKITMREAGVLPVDVHSPLKAPATLDRKGLLRVCLPATVDVFPDVGFEALGVPLTHDGRAWVGRLPVEAPGAAAVTFRDGPPRLGDVGTPDAADGKILRDTAGTWRVDLDTARGSKTCSP